jgi:hypothetical protein
MDADMRPDSAVLALEARPLCHRFVSDLRRRDGDNPRTEAGDFALANRPTVRIARILAIVVVTGLLCLGVGILYAGWPPFVGEPNFRLNGTGYVAMAIALIAAILFGLGLALLVHYDRRHR